MDSKATLVTIVTLAQSRSAVTNIKELIDDVNNSCLVLHSQYLETVCHTTAQHLYSHPNTLTFLTLDLKVLLCQFVTGSELTVFSISLQNLVKVSFLQIGEPVSSLPPQSPFQDVCPEILDRVWDVRNNVDKLCFPNWIRKLKIKCINY